MTFLACLVCKITFFVLKITGRGGTTLPGRMALKIKPDILKKLSRNVNIVLVTGLSTAKKAIFLINLVQI